MPAVIARFALSKAGFGVLLLLLELGALVSFRVAAGCQHVSDRQR